MNANLRSTIKHPLAGVSLKMMYPLPTAPSWGYIHGRIWVRPHPEHLPISFQQHRELPRVSLCSAARRLPIDQLSLPIRRSWTSTARPSVRHTFSLVLDPYGNAQSRPPLVIEKGAVMLPQCLSSYADRRARRDDCLEVVITRGRGWHAVSSRGRRARSRRRLRDVTRTHLLRSWPGGDIRSASLHQGLVLTSGRGTLHGPIACTRWRSVRPPPGDVILFRIGRCFANGGVVSTTEPLGMHSTLRASALRQSRTNCVAVPS